MEKELEKLVRELDFLITNKPHEGSINQFYIDEWLFDGDLFYCSDGGYSRFFFHFDYGKVCLDSVSTKSVYKRWDDADVKILRVKIDKLAQKLVMLEDPEWQIID